MIVQNEHWYGQPRPASKLALRPRVRATYRFGRNGTGVASILGRSFMKSYKDASRPSAASRNTMSSRSSASPANMAMPMSRQISRSTARPSNIDRHPDTWKPPMATWMPASRNGRAISRARGYWFDWTPVSATRPKLPWDRKRARSVGTSMRVLVSSITSISMATSGPSTCRSAQSAAIP